MTTVTIVYNYQDKVLDFYLDGIAGFFRVCNSDGVNLEKIIEHVQKNYEFFSTFYDFDWCQTDTNRNWGGGWEWEETSHPKLAKGYRLGTLTSWYTVPFGSRANPAVQQMNQLYAGAIKSMGVHLLLSYDSNRQPMPLLYFFPDA